ncbi:NAD(P)H-hydrate dehydratase [Heliophilum fasciatum]|uniref:Bifunctional NAD(P)H-hydrate repair enzyme n=1 Tax=Heliophilum fasciatum TaxID=35700 RepID=A0A4R2RZG0_9FIRM|nr:NAD(P)H-hydrate dehydratase [Heliophilum fasciatum]MCW2276695.1 NAD(P)H-hydrate epimerase [Heliophilum fasciatum]TCP68924.1 NAD(P)H-hydrate epimerase [Heliophilum fasciatum]
MQLVTATEMRRLDERAMAEYGIPSIVLMENAGAAVARACLPMLGGMGGGQQKVLILCGKGNNGGDGFVAARHLMNAGVEVKLFLLAQERDVKGDALTNLTIFQRIGGKIYSLMDTKDINALRMALLSTHLVIDAIYGTGFTGELPALIARAVTMVREAALPVLAVDVPTGLHADTGHCSTVSVAATRTVTFGLPKLGLVLEPGATLAGDLVVADISLPRDLLAKTHIPRQLLTAKGVAAGLPERKASAHKGNFGHLLLVGGKVGMAGALALSVAGALRSGVGKLTAAMPEAIVPLVAPLAPEAMTWPLPSSDGSIHGVALRAGDYRDFTALVVGPGLGRHQGGGEVLQTLFEATNCPVVVDADGLFALAGSIELLAAAQGPVVLTPHLGEMARLTGMTVEAVAANRVNVALQAAREWGSIVVLKGARTVIASPDGQLCVNTTGNAGMATGGSGDVLAGIIGALLAQGVEPLAAAALGVFVHGLAGDRAAGSTGQLAMKAGDLVTHLADAWQQIGEEKQVS